MPTIGRYCKAYPISRLRAFSQWTETSGNSRSKEREATGTEGPTPRQLTDNDLLYLQENFVVTDGIFRDENVIFDRVTPEWIDYCKTELKFEVPAHESAEAKAVGAVPQTP